MIVRRAVAAAILGLFAAFSSLSLSPAAHALDKPAKQNCGFEKVFLVGSKFVQINPGGGCRYFRLRFEFMLNGPTSTLPKMCYSAKVIGSAKEYGPFCSTGGRIEARMPGEIEWISSSVPVTVYVKRCKVRSDCFR